MLTLKAVDEINVGAAVLPQQRKPSEPPTIELREALVQGFVKIRPDGEPVVVMNLDTAGVDASSELASNNGLAFEVRVANRVVACGRVALGTNVATLVEL